MHIRYPQGNAERKQLNLAVRTYHWGCFFDVSQMGLSNMQFITYIVGVQMKVGFWVGGFTVQQSKQGLHSFPSSSSVIDSIYFILVSLMVGRWLPEAFRAAWALIKSHGSVRLSIPLNSDKQISVERKFSVSLSCVCTFSEKRH